MGVIKERVVSISDKKRSPKIKPLFKDFHYLKMEGDYEYPAHCHDNYEIILVKNGPYYCTLNNEELTVNKNQLLIIKPGDQHQDHLFNHQTHYVLHMTLTVNSFTDSMPLDLFKKEILPKEQILITKDNWNPESFFKTMDENIRLGDKYSYTLQDPLIEIFFWNMVRLIPEDLLSSTFKDISVKQLFRDNLINLFERRYREILTVEDIARELNMSKRSLTNYTRQYFNNSPAKLFLKYRMDKSIELLNNPNSSINEISYYLGFDNQFHFSRVFKRVFGFPPSKNRKDI